MKVVKCIRNCKNDGLVDCICGLDNFFTCKNCLIEHCHYYIYTKFVKTHYMCSFCKIETPIQKEPEQIKLL